MGYGIPPIPRERAQGAEGVESRTAQKQYSEHVPIPAVRESIQSGVLIVECVGWKIESTRILV